MIEEALPCYVELPPLPVLMRELSKSILDGTDATKSCSRWPQIWEIGKTYFFSILFFVVAAIFVGILKFHIGLWGWHGFVSMYGKTILYGLLLCIYGQFFFQLFAMVRPLRHLLVETATWTQAQYDQERDLAKRLSHLPSKVLQECGKRVDMEINILKQISLFGMLLSAAGALGQLHFSSEPILQGIIIGFILIVVSAMRMIRQYSRLAFVLDCAGNSYAS
jgi:hypothetical protein